MIRTARLAGLLVLLAAPAFSGGKIAAPEGVKVPQVPALAVPASVIPATDLHAYGAAAGNLRAYGAATVSGQHAYGHPIQPGESQAYGPAALSPQAQEAAAVRQAQGALSPVSAELSKPDLSPSQAHAAAAADWAPRVGEAIRPLDVMMVAAEAVPFIKTGGLADVLDGLGRELAAKGQRVTLVLPNYRNLKRDGLSPAKVAQIQVPVAGRSETLDVLHERRQGVDLWLLDGALFNARDGPYAHEGKLHEDGDERFAVLARGALEAAKALGRKPDIVHAHDWHAALVAPMLKLLYHDDPAFVGTRSVVTIHNIAYQGNFGAESVRRAGFSMHDFAYDKLAHNGEFNYLKSGLQYADAITTVSPTYAKETLTPAFGVGLEGLLAHRRQDYSGIINGLDPAQWNPALNELGPYDADTALAGKALAKAEVQRRFGLDADPSKPLFAILSRVDPQKGVDLVAANGGVIDGLDGQLFVLGGAQHEPSIDHLKDAMPGRFFRHAFDTVLPRLLLQAADFLLMPSRFEPCGLSQLQAMLMGTIPIVTPTGGLADTVIDVSREGGTGIVIKGPDAMALAEGIARARRLYDQPEKLAQARRNGMNKDVSWSGPADSYLELFRRLVFGQPAESGR